MPAELSAGPSCVKTLLIFQQDGKFTVAPDSIGVATTEFNGLMKKGQGFVWFIRLYIALEDVKKARFACFMKNKDILSMMRMGGVADSGPGRSGFGARRGHR